MRITTQFKPVNCNMKVVNFDTHKGDKHKLIQQKIIEIERQEQLSGKTNFHDQNDNDIKWADDLPSESDSDDDNSLK